MKKIFGLLAFISSFNLVQATEAPHLFNKNDVGVLLSDEVLGSQRGKFVAGPQAHYFGIEFVTSVTGPSGNIMTSGMQLNINFNRNQPSVTVNGYSNENSLPSSVQPNNAGSHGQLANGSGLVQVGQVAGNANAGINDFIFVPGQMQLKGNALNQGHYQVSLPDGLVSYDFNNNGLGMSYSAHDGSTNATQMLRGSKDNQGFVQQFSITDNNKLLSNQAKFYIGDQLNANQDLAKVLQQQLPTGIR